MELGKGIKHRKLSKVHEVMKMVVVVIIPAWRNRRLGSKLFGHSIVIKVLYRMLSHDQKSYDVGQGFPK